MARTLRFADKGGAIVKVAKQTTQSADDVAGLIQGLKAMLPSGKQLAGLGVVAAGVPALLEFTDTKDPVARNAMQAGGRFAGSLGLGTAGALLGSFAGPVGTFVGGTLGGMLGDAVGGGALGGVYDAIAGTPEDRRREEELKDSRNKTKMELERATELMPVIQKLADMQAAREVNIARRNMEILNDYNFANRLSTSSLMSQQNEANALAIAMQKLL